MNQPDTFNRSWDFEVNLSGVQAPTGMDFSVPEGYYEVLVTDMYVNAEKNPNRVIVKATIADGNFKGLVRTDGLGKPQSDTDKVRHYWRALAESVGYTAAQLDSGAISLGRDSFVGRQAYIRYIPADEAAGRQFDRIVWLNPGEWAKQKQTFETTEQAAPAATATANTATPTNGLGAKGTLSKSSLLGKLGVTA